MLRELVDDAVVAVLASRGVEVHARNLLARKHLVNLVLDALSAIAHNLDAGVATRRAHRGQRDGVTTVVAGERLHPAVIGERDVAVDTSGHPRTLLAAHHGSIAATVLEENHLLVVVQRLAALVY